MADDIFRDCDCDCDCDCSCDDCLPDNTFILICCCLPSAQSDPNRTNTTDRHRHSDCFPCCCFFNAPTYTPQARRGRTKKRKKKGLCWRLWCCFARKDPSPPPSPPPPRPEALPPGGYMGARRYPLMEDLGMPSRDYWTNDRLARDWGRDQGRDWPPKDYRGGLRYPVHEREDMRMYRNEYRGLGKREELHMVQDDRKTEKEKTSVELDVVAKRELGMVLKDDGKNEKNKTSVELDVSSSSRDGKAKREDLSEDERSLGPEELYMTRGDCHRHGSLDDGDELCTSHNQRLHGEESKAVKYEVPGRQSKS